MPTLAELEAVARGAPPQRLGDADRERIAAARAVVEAAVDSEAVVYGVTTGFGQLASVSVPPADAARLQINLLRSHAVGAGPPLDDELVRAMLHLLAASLRRGHSGTSTELVELVVALLEHDVVPVVPSRGSVGSSGDLVPLAHLALVLIGEGEASVAGERLPGAEALSRAGLEPVVLSAKEGLALINGTHLMAAAGALAVRDAQRLVEVAIVAAALSLEAFKGSTVPFDERLHEVRSHPGPVRVAARLRSLLEGSEVVASHADCGRVQDPYTLRCVPQVIGAVDDALAYVPPQSSASSTPSRTTRWSSRGRTPAAGMCWRGATSTASHCRCRSTTWRSPSASLPRSASGAPMPSSPRATPSCPRSCRRGLASARG